MNKKPSAIHECTGAYRKNPGRRNKNEPMPRLGVGSAPASPATDFAAVWDEIVEHICPGVLGNSDRFWLEITCELLCEFRKDPESISSAKINQLQKGLAHLGMNPIDRSRVAAITSDEPDPTDKYFT